jgi:uncharacterized membrane protein
MSRARRLWVVGILVLATFIGFLSILARWADQQALDTNEWTDTSTKLLEDAEIRRTLANYLVDQLYANVDVQAELRSILPTELKPLAGPASGGLRDASYSVANRALESARVQQLWEDANRTAHKQFIAVVEDKGNPDVSTSGGNVTIDLQTLLTQIAQRVGIGQKLVDKLPPDSAQLTVLKSDQLSAAQTGAKLLDKGAIAITILTLLLFALAVYLARGRRRETLRGVAIGFMVAGLLALIVRSIVGGIVVDELAKTAAIEPSAQDIWNIGTGLLRTTAWAAVINGLLLLIVVLLAGPTRYAKRLRQLAAPYMKERPELTYGFVTLVFLLLVWWGPTPAFRTWWTLLTMVVLLIVGTEALRRQTEREFPDAHLPVGEGP